MKRAAARAFERVVVVVVALAALSALASVGAARAQDGDGLLRGPHPFLKDDALAVHAGYAVGLGDTFAGPRAAVDYGHRLAGGLWLDIGLRYLAGACRPRSDEPGCGREGDAVEVLAGVEYRLRMNVPVVPYTKLVAGPVYLFPEEAGRAIGIVLRGGGGARYFFYDWFGVGAEITLSVGHAAYDDGARLARTLGGIDLLAGAEVQF